MTNVNNNGLGKFNNKGYAREFKPQSFKEELMVGSMASTTSHRKYTNKNQQYRRNSLYNGRRYAYYHN